MSKLGQVREWQKSIISLLLLYAGKSSGILVNLFFIPLYSRYLGTEQFGIVAVILSMQALLLMLDLGLSTLVNRDIASGQAADAEYQRLIDNAELALLALYVLLVLVVWGGYAVGVICSVSLSSALLSVALFGLLVLQNLYYCVILARRKYSIASMIQLFGNLSRAIATAVVLIYYSATLPAFIVVQVVFAALHACITRQYCRYQFDHFDKQQYHNLLSQARWWEVLSLIHRGRSLVLFSLAGAAVMQLDKAIIALFMNPASVTPYYLAMTFCMVPISILAGPVSQYFQPRLLQVVAQGSAELALQVIRNYVLVLLIVTLLPSSLLWLFRESFLELWLGSNQNIELIASYTAVLMPGVSIGALGFIPYTLLLSIQDYRFQGLASSLLSTVILGVVALAAYHDSINLICLAYALYHIISTSLSWGRSILLSQVQDLGIFSLALAAKVLFFILLVVLACTSFVA